MGKQADTLYSRKPSKPQEIPAFLILFCGKVLCDVFLKDEQGCPSPAQRHGLDKLELNSLLFPCGQPDQLSLFPSENTEFIYKEKVLLSHFLLKEKVASSCCCLAGELCVKYPTLRIKSLSFIVILILKYMCSADLLVFENY